MNKRQLARATARHELAMKRALVEAREAVPMSQAELARRMGVDRSTISRMEKLDSNPRLSELTEYAMHVDRIIAMTVEVPQQAHAGLQFDARATDNVVEFSRHKGKSDRKTFHAADLVVAQ